MQRILAGVWLASLWIFTAACSSAHAVTAPPVAARTAVDTADLDTAVSPRNDFYRYANGGWLARNTLPSDYSRWGTFEVLAKENDEHLRLLVDQAQAANGKPGSPEQQVGDFFTSGMNAAALEKAGVQPLATAFKEIAAVHDAKSLANVVATLHRRGAGPLFGFGAQPDAKDSNMVIAQVYQGGLGLPTRDDYANSNDRRPYGEHVAKMLKLAGFDEVEARVQAVLDIETALAAASLSEVQRRDPVATYNKTDVSEMARWTPGFDWHSYLTTLGASQADVANVESPAFLRGMQSTLEKFSWDAWHAYLIWHLLAASAPYLNEALVNEHFEFYSKHLNGTPARKPRWQEVLDTTSGYLGEALGKLYVKQYFSEESKTQAVALVHNLQNALRQRLETLTWMSPATRAHALEKLDRLVVKMGYPDKWIDYSSLVIGPNFLENVWAADAFLVAREMKQIGLPPDRTRWEMTPQTVNAYYSPATNEIVFPAAILQPPFFDAQADAGSNYGAIGVVIGHELTHGYDDQGRQFDAHGNMVEWWTPEDAAEFKRRAAIIIDQFNHYEVFNHRVNGDLTQGENIADLGGGKIALFALKKALANGAGVARDDFTPEQHFFLAWARVWRNHIRESNALRRLQKDPHSPGIWRVNGPMSNMPEFYEAFGVHPQDGMWRPDPQRVDIW